MSIISELMYDIAIHDYIGYREEEEEFYMLPSHDKNGHVVVREASS